MNYVNGSHGDAVDQHTYLPGPIQGATPETAWQQPYQAPSTSYRVNPGADPYTVHGFASTAGSGGSINSGSGLDPGSGAATYIPGVLPDGAPFHGPDIGGVYGGSTGGAPVMSTARHPAPPSLPLVLTHPSVGANNEGADNENSDLIITVGDIYESNHTRYEVLGLLGQGTFGQVVKCLRSGDNEHVAVKIIKNQQAYFQQARVEVGILQMLNMRADPDDMHHIVRMHDFFVHRNHLCLVFELLGANLYELIKKNQFNGLRLTLVRPLVVQVLEALAVLRDEGIIHCDLKPENVLLTTCRSGKIKVIDFGSACMQQQTVYTYIQSRFYRSPEVLLGYQYSAAIDMWSLGCVAAELYLGLPLFPGASEHDLLTRVVEMLGPPPEYLLQDSKHTNKYYHHLDVPEVSATGASTSYKLQSREAFEAATGVKAASGKRYFTHEKLHEIVREYPVLADVSCAVEWVQEREAFIDFLSGVLNLDPARRWTPRQALEHPFIKRTRFVQPFQPPAERDPPGHVSRRRANSENSQRQAVRNTGAGGAESRGRLPSPGTGALLANSPQAHEQAHAAAMATMAAQYSPQLAPHTLHHHHPGAQYGNGFVRGGAVNGGRPVGGGIAMSLPAPQAFTIPGTSPNQAIPAHRGMRSHSYTSGPQRRGGGSTGGGSLGSGSVGGFSQPAGPYDSPQVDTLHSMYGGSMYGDGVMASPQGMGNVGGMGPGLSSSAHTAGMSRFLTHQQQQIQLQEQSWLSQYPFSIGSAGLPPAGSMGRSLPGLRGQQAHYGSYITGAAALSTHSQSYFNHQALQQTQNPGGDPNGYRSAQMLGGMSPYSAAPSSYDSFASPQRQPRLSGMSHSPYGSMYSPVGSARQLSGGGGGGGGGGAGFPAGTFRRVSYTSQIPEDAPFVAATQRNDVGADRHVLQPGLDRPLRRNSDGASLEDLTDWEPIHSDDPLIAEDISRQAVASSSETAFYLQQQQQQQQQWPGSVAGLQPDLGIDLSTAQAQLVLDAAQSLNYYQPLTQGHLPQQPPSQQQQQPQQPQYQNQPSAMGAWDYSHVPMSVDPGHERQEPMHHVQGGGDYYADHGQQPNALAQELLHTNSDSSGAFSRQWQPDAGGALSGGGPGMVASQRLGEISGQSQQPSWQQSQQQHEVDELGRQLVLPMRATNSQSSEMPGVVPYLGRDSMQFE